MQAYLCTASSIPSPYRYRNTAGYAYDFVTFVKECNHKSLVGTSVGITTYGDSPLSKSYSAFLGVIVLFDLDMLNEAGFLLKSERLFQRTGLMELCLPCL